MNKHNLKLDDPIIMITPLGDKFNCHFAGGYDDDGFPLVWICGNTSWSIINHPKKFFKPSGGWCSFEIPEKKPVTIHQVVCYDYCEDSYVISSFFNIRDAYKLIIKTKYDYCFEAQNERLIYDKQHYIHNNFYSYYITKTEVF